MFVVSRPNRNFMQKAALYSGLALVLPVATVAGYLFGYWLDERFGTTWLRLVFLILGTAGGFLQLFRQIVRDSKDE
jgi:F0F1-type ATP synthase assembly protein I